MPDLASAQPAAPATVAQTPPTDDALRAYVSAVYDLLLGRQPDSAGMNYWVNLLKGGLPREDVARAITNADEFRAVLLADHYEYFLLRPIDQAGLQYFLSLMRSGQRIEDIDVSLIASQEYYDFAIQMQIAQPPPSDSTHTWFIRLVYDDLLGREPDPAGFSYWEPKISGGPSTDPRVIASRAQVAAGIVYSTEALTPVVQGYYEFILGRAGDSAGIAYWVQQIQAGTRDEDVIGLLAGSQEFFDLAT